MKGLKANRHYDSSRLVQLLESGKLEEVIQTARQLRNERYKGASLFEFLAQIHYRNPKNLILAKTLLKEIDQKEVYPLPFSWQEMDHSLMLSSGSYVLHYELPVFARDKAFNPAKRAQIFGSIQSEIYSMQNPNEWKLNQILKKYVEFGLSRGEYGSFLTDYFIELGDLKMAFDFMISSFEIEKPSPKVVASAYKLFDSIPYERRLNIIYYPKRGGGLKLMRTFGVSPVEGKGFIMKEYDGCCGANTQLTLQKVPPISQMEIWRDPSATHENIRNRKDHFEMEIRRRIQKRYI